MAFPFFGKKPLSTGQGSANATQKHASGDKSSDAVLQAMEPAPEERFSLMPETLTRSSSGARAPNIEINLTAPELDPFVEEAAMLFASDQPTAARAALEPEVRQGNCAEGAWWMLFELHQILGEREAFDGLALDYAARFEKSPPTWIESQAGLVDPRVAGARVSLALPGTLNAKSDDVLKQLMRMAASNQAVRLDLSKVKDADNGGCALLLNALRKLRRDRRECALNGADRLAVLLAGKVAAGRRENEETWLLLLELYQSLNSQEPFEEMALQYAITFEMSPPSWEIPNKKLAGAASPAATSTTALAHANATLAGEIIGGGSAAFAAIETAAQTAPEIVIDASRLQRMDFVSAGMLLNVMIALQAAGKTVRISSVSYLVAGLFDIVGIGQIAAVETRKY